MPLLLLHTRYSEIAVSSIKSLLHLPKKLLMLLHVLLDLHIFQHLLTSASSHSHSRVVFKPISPAQSFRGSDKTLYRIIWWLLLLKKHGCFTPKRRDCDGTSVYFQKSPVRKKFKKRVLNPLINVTSSPL